MAAPKLQQNILSVYYKHVDRLSRERAMAEVMGLSPYKCHW